MTTCGVKKLLPWGRGTADPTLFLQAKGLQPVCCQPAGGVVGLLGMGVLEPISVTNPLLGLEVMGGGQEGHMVI